MGRGIPGDGCLWEAGLQEAAAGAREAVGQGPLCGVSGRKARGWCRGRLSLGRLPTDPHVRGRCPAFSSGLGEVQVRMSSGQVRQLGELLSVDRPGQTPLLSGWWYPPSALPHGPRRLPELREPHHAAAGREEGEERDGRTCLGLSFPRVCGGRRGLLSGLL